MSKFVGECRNNCLGVLDVKRVYEIDVDFFIMKFRI